MAWVSAELKGKLITLAIIIGCIGAAVLLGVILFEFPPWSSPATQASVVSLSLLEGGVSDDEDTVFKGVLESTTRTSLEKALHLMARYPLVDGHNDFPWNLRNMIQNDLRELNFTGDLNIVEPWASNNRSHTDLPRLRNGRVGVQFWVAYTDCESQGKDSVAQTIEQIDVIQRLTNEYPEDLQLCTNLSEIVVAVQNKKIASLIGVEGGHSIQSSPAILRQMYHLGVRYMTLTHKCNTPWADASPVDDPAEKQSATNSGLSPFGLDLVDEMNRLGMLIDLSHTSEASMKAVLKRSKAPIIFSHSAAKAVCDHHRNVPDSVLLELKMNGGIIMVTFCSKFIQCNSSKNATLEDVIAHFQHIRNLIGLEHIGIGADYDGTDRFPEGLEDVSKYPHLIAALIDSGWTLTELKRVLFTNFARVMRAVEKVSEKLGNESQRMEPMQLIISKEELHRKGFEISNSSCVSSKSLASLSPTEHKNQTIISKNSTSTN